MVYFPWKLMLQRIKYKTKKKETRVGTYYIATIKMVMIYIYIYIKQM